MPSVTPNTLKGRLQGRVAIITGSSGALGRAVAVLFASEGAKCFCVDKYANPRNPVNAKTGKADDWNSRLVINTPPETPDDTDSDGDEDFANSMKPTHRLLQSQYGLEAATFHAADLTNESEVADLVQACVQLYGRVDNLVNAHGISTESTHPTPLRCHDLPLSDFLLTQSINTTSLFLTCKYFLAQALKQSQIYDGGLGSIINVASVQGLVPYFATPGYCASKGAVVMMTKQIALDYAPDGIRCNAVCPGFLDTNMTRNLQQDGNQEVFNAVKQRQPLAVGTAVHNKKDTGVGMGGLGKVEDVARMVLVMAGDDIRWMTGQAVVVDGGYTIS